MQTKDKFILITGASSDIGCSIAKTLSFQNNIIFNGRSLDKIEHVIKKVASSNKTLIWIQDLSDPSIVQNSLAHFVREHDISITGFIHCSGALKILPVKNFRFEYFQNIFNVNVFSAVEIIRHLVKKSNLGSLRNIIFISALFSKFGDKGNSMYAASKGALDTMVKSLAVELAPHVRVNSVLPGAIKTTMTKHLFEDESYLKTFNEKYLLGEGKSEDIANMVDFLLSDKASWITGQNFQVDGGASSH